MAMDENYISNLGLDSLRSFSARYSFTIQTYYYPAKEKLDEMLIPNAQYSNHPAIINLDKFYREKDKKKFEDNLNFINNRLNYLFSSNFKTGVVSVFDVGKPGKEKLTKNIANYPSNPDSRELIWFIVRSELVELFEWLEPFITRKLKKIVQRNTGVEQWHELLEQYRKETDIDKQLKLMEKMEKIEDKIEEHNKNLAFQGFEDQQQCVNVAQYHGEWTMSKSGSRMRAWYVCMMDGNGQWDPCGTIMPAKHWLRRFEDVGSSKQRWYCVCCGTRFKTKYGMLVEIHITTPKPTSIFMRSEISNQDVDDVRAMHLERTLKPTDHQDLWQKIPDFKPMAPGDIMRPCKESEFHKREGFDKSLIHKFNNPAGLKDVPKWDWDRIFAGVFQG